MASAFANQQQLVRAQSEAAAGPRRSAAWRERPEDIEDIYSKHEDNDTLLARELNQRIHGCGLPSRAPELRELVDVHGEMIDLRLQKKGYTEMISGLCGDNDNPKHWVPGASLFGDLRMADDEVDSANRGNALILAEVEAERRAIEQLRNSSDLSKEDTHEEKVADSEGDLWMAGDEIDSANRGNALILAEVDAEKRAVEGVRNSGDFSSEDGLEEKVADYEGDVRMADDDIDCANDGNALILAGVDAERRAIEQLGNSGDFFNKDNLEEKVADSEVCGSTVMLAHTISTSDGHAMISYARA